jgi:hypothetical protein
MDWKDAAVGGGAAMLLEVCLFAVGRSDLVRKRREDRMKELALAAVRESEEFTNAEAQEITNRNVLTALNRIETAITQIHGVLFSRRSD